MRFRPLLIIIIYPVNFKILNKVNLKKISKNIFQRLEFFFMCVENRGFFYLVVAGEFFKCTLADCIIIDAL